jgi:predicted aminopeptidase
VILHRRLWLFSILLFSLIFSGCAQLGYYTQSVLGQLDIWRREKPISDVIGDTASPRVLRDKLAQVLAIREYASRELALPENRSYRRYADLERPFVVWNVFATHEFSMQPQQWCFAVAGCVSYRGYFAKADAEHFAAGIAASGYDVHIGGVPAYSTLGWFADPVLNTFVNYPSVELARLIFHELSHQVVYVKDDSVFNESFATAVERAGVERWIVRHGASTDREVVAQMQHQRADFVRLIQSYRERLATLFRSGVAAESMRAEKKKLYSEMRADYQTLKQSWGGYAGYDRWFAQPPNNALLASVSIYTQQVPAFEAMLQAQGGDLVKFFAAVKAIAQRPKVERDAALAAYVHSPVAAGTQY